MSKRRRKLTFEKVVEKVLGNSLFSFIQRMFQLMEITENEIEKAKQRWPERTDMLHRSFMLLRPTSEAMSDVGEVFYRHHCREILRRVAEGGDTRMGTTLEVVLALREASLVSPLKRDPAVLYAKLFMRCGQKVLSEDSELARLMWDMARDESYRGACDEIESDLRRKLSVSDRVLQPER